MLKEWVMIKENLIKNLFVGSWSNNYPLIKSKYGETLILDGNSVQGKNDNNLLKNTITRNNISSK